MKIYLLFYSEYRLPVWLLTLVTCLLFLKPGYSINKDHSTRLDSASLAVKSIQAIRIQTPPKIDAMMDEPFWQTIPPARDFVEYMPDNGSAPAHRTEVRFAYDDMALYIYAIMYDPHPDSICNELGKRDQLEQLNTDLISFDILPYNDGLNMFEFKISPAGIQNDCKYSAVGQDITWDAVWESATAIKSGSWEAEIKLPYSALRFPKVDKQVWGFNMWRSFRRAGEWSTWSFIDNSAQNVLDYYGTLVGIEKVNPPMRLSFAPYVAGYTEKNPVKQDWQYSVRGGMDVRYGINEAYTLDMMLIPDFGQVQSDDIILNLTPFEVQYNEKRQFFTEATELFSKCGIFYSRRVGATPINFNAPYDSANENEKVLSNPEQTRIINATKISGRNSKGLGVGFFNAMTTNTWGELENTTDGSKRRIMTQPFTNYNVSVIDKNLKNNSYVTLINTNYYIPATRYIANVTGAESKLSNKKNTFNFLGRLNVSQKYYDGDSTNLGYQYLIKLSKPTGKLQYHILRSETGSTYDPNEMGFLTYNNSAINQLKLLHIVLSPVWKIRYSQTLLEVKYSTLVKPYSYTDLYFNLSNGTTFKNFWANYLEIALNPIGSDDYYESRIWGKIYKRPWSYAFTWNIDSDGRKRLRTSLVTGISNSPENKNFGYFVEVTPRLRFSDRFMVSLTLNYTNNLGDYGWVGTDHDTLGMATCWFGKRDVTTINNVLNLRYIFNTRISLALRLRHYWSNASYAEYYTLNQKGTLTQADYGKNADVNFNAFTGDLNFAWNFAPGSELSIVWKNSIYTQDQDKIVPYLRELNHTINAPQTNGFSIRFLYYLDYLYLKKWASAKPGAK